MHHNIMGNMMTVCAAARADKLAQAGQKEAPAEWLGQVSQPMKDVMSAMQQMASVGVHINEQKDVSHTRVVQSMSPDALLACGTCCLLLAASEVYNAAVRHKHLLSLQE